MMKHKDHVFLVSVPQCSPLWALLQFPIKDFNVQVIKCNSSTFNGNCYLGVTLPVSSLQTWCTASTLPNLLSINGHWSTHNVFLFITMRFLWCTCPAAPLTTTLPPQTIYPNLFSYFWYSQEHQHPVKCWELGNLTTILPQFIQMVKLIVPIARNRCTVICSNLAVKKPNYCFLFLPQNTFLTANSIHPLLGSE